ncbi:MAG TPA: SpoIIE family protein phosphatase [bacterium]|nr:SpoIIE family protein phosphatase [bacterium]HPN45399.1 SpoIIE family protein phosphatase [bacterium]
MEDAKEPGIVNSELDQRHVELKSLFETSKVLNSSLQLNTILNNLLLTPMGRMMISRGLVMVSEDGNKFSIRNIKGLSRELLNSTCDVEFRFDKPVFLTDVDLNECKLKNFFLELGIELILPINSTSRMIGMIALGKKINRSRYTEAELEFLNSLTNLASTAIENAIIFQKLESVNRKLDTKIQQLNTIFDIGRELNSTLDKKKIVNLLVYAIMGEMAAQRCNIFLKKGTKLTFADYRGGATKTGEMAVFADPDLLRELADVTKPFLVKDTILPSALAPLRNLNINAVVPMRIQDKTGGVVLLGERINHVDYTADDLEFLATLCNAAAISLENARLFDETIEKQRMEEELNIAREIQTRLLPDSYPEYDHFEIMGYNVPSREVGGDYFDCIRLDQHRFAIAIGDVSGKGAPASLLMSNLHAGLHTLIMTKADITTILSKLNNLIQAHTTFDKFITFFYAEINIDEFTLTYANAGHNPPFLYRRDGSCMSLEKGGLLLGMMPNLTYETETIQLKPGDQLLMFTDGVTEAMNTLEMEYGEWRLQAILEYALKNDLKIQELINKIVVEVKDFSQGMPQADDITMLGLKVLN